MTSASGDFAKLTGRGAQPRPRPVSAPPFPPSPRLPAFLPGSPSAHIGAPQDGGWQWGEVSAPCLSLSLFKLALPCQRPGAQSLSFFQFTQPESEVFEITDFTTASEWERWVSRIIGYQQFGPWVRPATSPTLTTSDATSAGKVSPLAPRCSLPPFCGPLQTSSTSRVWQAPARPHLSNPGDSGSSKFSFLLDHFQ